MPHNLNYLRIGNISKTYVKNTYISYNNFIISCEVNDNDCSIHYIYNFLNFITKNESIYLIKYPILFDIYLCKDDYDDYDDDNYDDYDDDDYDEYYNSDKYYNNIDKKIINKYITILNKMKQDINKYKFKVYDETRYKQDINKYKFII